MPYFFEDAMDQSTLKKLIATCKPLRVLYAEDNPQVRLQTTKMLSMYFDHIVSVADGKEAWEQFQAHPFDMVFTDINMAGMDGLGLIEAIRGKDVHVPIVVFSAYNNPEYFLTTIKLGIQGYLLKPFQFEEVVQTLQKILNLSHHASPCALELEGGYCWDKQTKCLCYEKQEVPLSKREMFLLDLLTSSKERIFSSEEIEIAVFDDDACDNKRVRNLLSRFRQKLSCDLICSVYGEGYKLRWHRP